MSLKITVIATLTEIVTSALVSTFGNQHTIDRDWQRDAEKIKEVITFVYDVHEAKNYPAAQINGQISELLHDFDWNRYVVSPSPVRCTIGVLNPITMNAMYSMLAALHALKKLVPDDAQLTLFDEMLAAYATAFQLMNIVWNNKFPTVVTA